MVEAAAQMQALGGEGKTFVRIGGTTHEREVDGLQQAKMCI